MKKNIKGFTLIELLAVIVILAIIALIAVPVIMNIISKANESAFKDSAYGIISAGELYFAERQLEPNGMLEDVTYSLPDTTKTLQLKGEVPTGTILITKEGKVAIAVHNNRYCVTKGIDDKDVTITENYESCNLPSVEEEPEENTSQTGSIKTLATTSTEVPEKPECLNDGTECAPGTPVAIQVNASEVYNFYVISDEENEVTLIMDRNIYFVDSVRGGKVAWINSEDYGCGIIGDYCSKANKPPLTAISTLKERTDDWDNIPEREYTYSDDGERIRYKSFSETMRARMLTYTEVNDIISANNDTMPSWMYINLEAGTHGGYWLSSTSDNSPNYARLISYDGSIATHAVYNSGYNGIRPVITLSK